MKSEVDELVERSVELRNHRRSDPAFEPPPTDAQIPKSDLNLGPGEDGPRIECPRVIYPHNA